MEDSHQRSLAAYIRANSASVAEETHISLSSLPTVHHLHDKSQDTLPESLTSSHTPAKANMPPTSSPVRRKPLPPAASRLVAKFSSGDHSVAEQDTKQIPSWQPPQQSRSAEFSSSFSKVAFPPWEDTNLISSSKENLGNMELHANIRQQSNPLSTEISQSLTTSNSPTPSIISSKHARTASSSSISGSEVTNICFSNPSSDSSSNSKFSSCSTEQPLARKMATLQTSQDELAIMDSSQLGVPSAASLRTSSLDSLFTWGENGSPPLTSMTVPEDICSPTSLHGTSKESFHVYESAPNDKITFKIDFSKSKTQSKDLIDDSTKSKTPCAPASPQLLEEMEKEFREISSDLVASIRRELELEEIVERLQKESYDSTHGVERRTSDYFSDSGMSSTKYSGDSEPKQDEIDRLRRNNEQITAKLRLELNTTVHEERAKQRKLELKVRDLEEKALHADLESMNSLYTSERVRELENVCEELRRRLSEERKSNENLDKLLTTIKLQLETAINERDNLRDEIVPQLQAQIEGLEEQASKHEKYTYEQTKIQQEIQALKDEESSLENSQKVRKKIENQIKRLPITARGTNAPEESESNLASLGPTTKQPPISGSSIKVTETREALAERVKDIELQRDSLHLALKSLLERQEHQDRENQKIIKQLESELERALLVSPKKIGYENEVKQLRSEINTLRVRADEALAQKVRCERNLGILKLELDRAEKEIKSLKKLLMREKHLSTRSENRSVSDILTSETLEDSYKELLSIYSQSLERIRTLETENLSKTNLAALKMIEQSLMSAISERCIANHEAGILRKQNQALLENEKILASQEMTQTKDLLDSATRFEELAAQVRQQLATNSKLRQRLSSIVERGEREQESSAERIKFLQDQVKSLEEQLYLAQNVSEERLSAHEKDVREMKENQITHLHRIKEGFRSPISPNMARSLKSPKSFSLQGSVSEDTQVDQLRQKIFELEQALSDTGREMERVVNHMKTAEIQVMDLRNEREEAIRETKRLQNLVDSNKLQVKDTKTWTSMLSL
ncbi:putative intracellular protein transport-like protein [Golovinomyces cichoracearum]|uniref:Putative intracellular protein transport-like protein n=1 Tax=Golovinomyces cichoracearum TaxID=62708 RepID=A0A420HAU9_9PEZI|nr:putative intracellular protein transport-like protein [Golovinomyces cichoracearum]